MERRISWVQNSSGHTHPVAANHQLDILEHAHKIVSCQNKTYNENSFTQAITLNSLSLSASSSFSLLQTAARAE